MREVEVASWVQSKGNEGDPGGEAALKGFNLIR